MKQFCAAGQVGEWRMPPPTVQAFLAAHPRLERELWTACVEPFVPRTMACHWMRRRRQQQQQRRLLGREKLEAHGEGETEANVSA